MATTQPYFPTSSSDPDFWWVAGGALLTLALGIALLYWIDQEWRSIDIGRRGLEPPPAPPEGGPPPPGPVPPQEP
jgi:hypothetical protein